MTDRIPYVGAIVHYVAADGSHYAAIITALGSGRMNDADGKPTGAVVDIAVMTIFRPTGTDSPIQGIQDEISKSPGTFHFVETSRVMVPRMNGG